MIVKILLLLGLLQLLRVTGKPIYCSGIYAGFILIFGLFLGNPFLNVLLFAAIGFVLSTIYFYLLHMFSDSWFYWLILIVGLLIGVI
jgi:hypothetical protein